ncbi:MAG: DUF1330 domain-containing protein [Gammaproteobacteria bacterium]
MSAYMLAICDVSNPHDNFKKYAQLSAALVAEHGGEYVVRGKPAGNVEGDVLEGKVIILTKFPSLDDLKAFVEGDKYQNEIKPLREGAGEFHIAYYEA